MVGNGFCPDPLESPREGREERIEGGSWLDPQDLLQIYVKNCSVYRNTVRVTLSLEI